MYPEFDGNLNTRIVSAPAQSMEKCSKTQTKPILKKTRDGIDTSEEEIGVMVSDGLELAKDRNSSEEQIVRHKIPQIISQGWLRSPDTISTSRVSIPNETGV